jgi:hypothetical protein
VLVNAAFALRVLPPTVVFGGEPISRLDYALHFSRAAAADEFARTDGRTWGYDPHFMAGYPMGTVFDVNNKGVEVLIAVLHRGGLQIPTAFNVLVLLTLALPAAAVWAAARNFGLTSWQQTVAAGLTLILWVLDSQVGMTWEMGIFASGLAMYGLPLSLSFLYRYRTSRGARFYLLFLTSAAALSVWHPLSFVFFFAPVTAYCWLTFPELRGLLVVFVGTVALLNIPFMIPVVQQWDLKTRSGYHWIGDIDAFLRDTLVKNDSGLRILITTFGVVGLRCWYIEGKREAAGLLSALVVFLMLSGYLAGELSAFRELETYRNVLMASFVLIIPASVAITTVGSSLLSRFGRRKRLIWVVATALVIIALTGRNLNRIAWVRNIELEPVVGDEARVIRWLGEEGSAAGRRVLVEPWQIGALVPWYTHLEAIGGPYPLVWMKHNFANFVSLRNVGVPDRTVLFGRDVAQFSQEELREYLRTYNIGLVVSSTPESQVVFDGSPWLNCAGQFGRYRTYVNLDQASPFLRGEGELRAEYGRLYVSRASAGEIVLDYHWAPFLKTEPRQEIVPIAVRDDPVPMIRIPANMYASFVITDR